MHVDIIRYDQEGGVVSWTLGDGGYSAPNLALCFQNQLAKNGIPCIDPPDELEADHARVTWVDHYGIQVHCDRTQFELAKAICLAVMHKRGLSPIAVRGADPR